MESGIYRIGLTKLSEDSNLGVTGPKFNVIFIHGLKGHPRKTWEGQVSPAIGANETTSKRRNGLFKSFRKPQTTAGEAGDAGPSAPKTVFWPKELLVQDLSNATVWTYGYNADVIGLFEANNKNSISQHGRDLKAALERDIDKNPIVFIVHSLGGIVLKDALRRSEQCQQRTRLILFLGTPHRGSPAADMGQIAANLARLALQDSNKEILRTLQIDSEILDNIHEEFIKFAVEQKIAVHSFQEAKGLTGIKGLSGKIVDNFSSKLDQPTIETVESIDADHQQMAKCFRREDETYRKVFGELKSRIRNGILEPKTSILLPLASGDDQHGLLADRLSALVASKRHFHMPFVPNRRFVGREEKLKELETRLLIDKDVDRLAIVGLGGIGKTQLARAFCYIVKTRYHNYSIFWVSAISSATFKQDYMKIAQQCSIPSLPNEDDVLHAVRSYLSSIETGNWLMVIDNADDQKLLLDGESGIVNYLPQSEAGLILFTTRYKEIADVTNYNIVDLEEMSVEEAELFLEKLLRHDDSIKDKRITRELLEELTYLPLAIVQAASYITKTSISIKKYLALMRTREKELIELLSQDFHDNTREKESLNAVFKTWLVSFDRIKRDEPSAAKILFFLSFLENKAIPLSILPSNESSVELTRAVGTLIGYSFLSKQGDDEVYDMHRLVHYAVKIWIQREQTVDEWAEKVISRLATIFPWNEWENRNLWRMYMPHAIRVLQENKHIETEQRADLCLSLGVCLDKDGRTSEAVKWISECVSWSEQRLPVHNPARLLALHQLAYTYIPNGQIEEAIEILEKVVAIKARVRAEDHPDRLASQHALAGAYQLNGQIEEAIEILEKVVAIRERVLAEDHPDRLASQHEVAGAYDSNGQIKEAISMLEKVIAIRTKVLAEDHPDRLASQHNLAFAYEKDDQIAKAITLMQHVVAVQKWSLRIDHPDRLLSEAALSRMLSQRAG